jgi:cytidylate kinase
MKGANVPVLTIDGPSGAGKGTVSRAVAKRLGWHYLDSGAIYRALAVAVTQKKVAVDDIQQIVRVARELGLSFGSGEAVTVLLNGKDITDRIQTEECGNLASRIAALPAVRQALLEKQREFQKEPGLVADGRDMGTVVFPQARYKVFLTANSRVRALRRYNQLIEKGIDVNLDKLTRELLERDRRDKERTESPLAAANDAILIDSSNLSVEEVIDRCLHLIAGR